MKKTDYLHTWNFQRINKEKGDTVDKYADRMIFGFKPKRKLNNVRYPPT